MRKNKRIGMSAPSSSVHVMLEGQKPLQLARDKYIMIFEGMQLSSRESTRTGAQELLLRKLATTSEKSISL